MKKYIILILIILFSSQISFSNTIDYDYKDYDTYTLKNFDIFYNGELILDSKFDFNNDSIDDNILAFKNYGTGGFLDVYVVDGSKEDFTLLFNKTEIYKGKIKLLDKKIIIEYPTSLNNSISSLEISKETIFYKESEIQSIQNTYIWYPEAIKSDTVYENPSKEILEQKFDAVGISMGIPPVILKAIALTESGMRQFKNGNPIISWDGGYGIMQITPTASQIQNGEYNIEKLKYDIDYNIKCGAIILLRKWGYAFSSRPVIPKINNSDPSILENWYFAIWAYNGWSESNNPNMIPYKFPSWTKTYAYQERVYEFMESYYNQKTNTFSANELPENGLPNSNNTYYLYDTHPINLLGQYQNNMFIARENLSLRDINLNKLSTISKGNLINVLSEPILLNGYFRAYIQDTTTNEKGYVAINWLDYIPNYIEGLKWKNNFSDISLSKKWNISLNGFVSLESFVDNFSLWNIEGNKYYKEDISIKCLSQSNNLSTFEIAPPFSYYKDQSTYIGIIDSNLKDIDNNSLKKDTYFIFDCIK